MMITVYAPYMQPYVAFGGRQKPTKNYFDFEEEFMEDNVRCIPMYVRFKLDACGIKLKLKEWSRMTAEERKKLAAPADLTPEALRQYRQYLKELVTKRTGNEATDLAIDPAPVWSNLDVLPAALCEQARRFNWIISLHQWRALNNLQRFALVKLCSSGHESRNLPRAIREFGLV